ncbi:MAG TPA: CAP domain-containing protein [Ilumatobacteraceae bacterium]|nr:CAP domain-containing protein [Ilumatobacteraceae bacterium]
MRLPLPRFASRALDHRVRTYGITAALGLFTMGGVVPQCAPAPPPAVVQVTNIQRSVVDSVNSHRAQAGRGVVSVDSRLTAAAQGHSDHMARQVTMTHAGAGSTDGGQRISNAGYRWTTWAENVAAGQETPAEVVAAWMNSSGHRANILQNRMVHIGVAATEGSNGVVYWTMVVAAG